MKTYSFTLILADTKQATLDTADALYAAGCDDATFGSRDGVAFVDFDRESEALEDAVRSAIANVRDAGLSVARVVSDEFDTIARVNDQLSTV